jgi:lipoprotein-anchoring transpeptidase ErfK/SrfK
MPVNISRALCTVALIFVALFVAAQTRPPTAAPALQTNRKAADLIRKQEPMKVNQNLLKQATPDNVHIVVSIPKQRAYLMIGEQIVADAPVSSGKRGHSTPTGHFTVLEKDPNHHSSLYGDFVDRSGRTVRAGVSARIDAAPSGTHFAGAAMKWFLRLTPDGVGMHIGILPGYPASHGCVRESVDGAKLFYDRVKVGTPVDVGDY